jgi:hypothetical protein
MAGRRAPKHFESSVGEQCHSSARTRANVVPKHLDHTSLVMAGFSGVLGRCSNEYDRIQLWSLLLGLKRYIQAKAYDEDA